MTAATEVPLPLHWSIDPHPSNRAIQALRQELIAYNIATAAIDSSRDIAVFLHDDHGDLRGGVVGNIWGQCLEIHYLWVHASLRGKGYGSRLLQMLEQEAISQQCHTAVLDTYSFQAPDFYQRLGYEVFGMVDGYPQDSTVESSQSFQPVWNAPDFQVIENKGLKEMTSKEDLILKIFQNQILRRTFDCQAQDYRKVFLKKRLA